MADCGDSGPVLTIAAAIVAVLAMLLVADDGGVPGGPRPGQRLAAPARAPAQRGSGGRTRPGSGSGGAPPLARPGGARPAAGWLPAASPKAPLADRPGEAAFSYYGGADASGMWLSEAPERHSVYASLSRLYSTADADPLVTGDLYRYADGVRRVYSQRTSLEDRQGLTEFNSSAMPGDVGCDVGPFGLDKPPEGADDGIPENWRFPETPIQWYSSRQRDFYGPDGPTPSAAGLYDLREPDHDPKMP